MSQEKVKEDPVKLHKDANTLYETGKYEEAKASFLRAFELYQKVNNFFDATTMLYKAGECSFTLKDYQTAVMLFLQSAELSFKKGYDRFGLSALEYVRDCYTAMNNEEKVEELAKKIREVKEELAASF